MHWIYADEAEQQHEFSEDDFPTLIAERRIERETLVWNEAMTDWQPCVSIRPDLFDDVPVPPILTPAQRRQIQTASPVVAEGVPPLDSVALCALIFGVLGVLCIQIFSLPGIICGHIALKRANDNPGNPTNKGFAIAGLITGYLGILLLIAILIFYGTAFAIGIAEGMDTAE